MRRIFLCFLLLATLAHAQSSLDDRRKALAGLYGQYWDALLDHSPEFASRIGDNRYDNKLSDLSPRAENDWTAREQDLMMRLARIDPAGLPAAEAKSRESLLTQFANDIEASGTGAWQLPSATGSGIYLHYPTLAVQLPFTTSRDYDDWTARLRALPDAIDQLISNFATGIDDHRVPPKSALERDLAELKALAAQKPEDTPFAAPLKKFPASIPQADQQRIQQETIDALAKGVLPAYHRLARFFEVSYIPAAQPAGQAKPASNAASLTWYTREDHILDQLRHAQETLGPKFDLKGFHDVVSSYGVMPLDTLDERVNTWIASQH